MTTTRRLMISLTAFTLLVVGGCVVLPMSYLVFSSLIDDWRHRRAFDVDLWRRQEVSQHDPHWPPRLCMVDDLLARGQLCGKTETQVVELLGLPTDKMVLPGTTGCQISYYLGPERGPFGIDSEALCIAFGTDGKVSRQWIHRD
jgi:hypothetical protein